MKQIPKHQAVVINGKLKLFDRPRFDEWVKGLNGKVELVVQPPRKPRSRNENNYYWGVIVQMIADHYGIMPEEVHHELKRMFLRKDDGTKPFAITRSTSELFTVEAEDYYAKCRMWAAQELQLYIPLPNEVAI